MNRKNNIFRSLSDETRHEGEPNERESDKRLAIGTKLPDEAIPIGFL